MALIQSDSQAKKDQGEGETVDQSDEAESPTLEHRVFDTTSAVAPVLLPIVETLGSLTEEQVAPGGQIGDDE
jgi:hypothetical protein